MITRRLTTPSLMIPMMKAAAPTATTIITRKTKTGLTKTGHGMTGKTKTGQAIDDACASNESWSVLDSLTLLLVRSYVH